MGYYVIGSIHENKSCLVTNLEFFLQQRKKKLNCQYTILLIVETHFAKNPIFNDRSQRTLAQAQSLNGPGNWYLQVTILRMCSKLLLKCLKMFFKFCKYEEWFSKQLLNVYNNTIIKRFWVSEKIISNRAVGPLSPEPNVI